MRRSVLAILLALSGMSALAAEPTQSAPPTSQPVDTQDTSGAVITLPAGAYLRHDWRHAFGTTPIRAGLFDSYLIVSDEIGAEIGIVTTPEFLELHVEAAAEPGFYVHARNKREIPSGALEAARTFDWRFVVRPQANINLRYERFWLYSRTTGYARFRNFVENDTFRKLVVKDEYSIEQATAPLFRVTNAGAPAAFWVYGEYTVGGVREYDPLPHRFSAGVIAENFLLARSSFDVDFNYSISHHPRPGPGIIFAWWHRW